MIHAAAYDISTGLFTGPLYATETEAELPHLQPGFAWYIGDCHPSVQALDLLTGQLVDRRPDKPEDSELNTWVWDEVGAYWRPERTHLGASLDARAERTKRMAECDWTQLPDVPKETREAWASYRQALRDITAQAGFPEVIHWPDAPV